MTRWLCKTLVWIFVLIFYRHKTYGKKNLPPGGGVIAPNHCSFLDPPLIGVSCPDNAHFLARESLFKAPFFGWLIGKLNTHPVKKGQGNLNTFKKAMELIQNGKKVVIFPEGVRSLDGNLKEGQLGVGLLAYRTGCNVIPVYIHGTYEIWNARRKLPKLKGRTACVFGTPIAFSHNGQQAEKKEFQKHIADCIMKRIADLKDWYLAGAHGTPP